MGEAVRREAVDDSERVAELIVETRPDDAGRKGMTHVSDILADMVPEIGHLMPVTLPFRLTKIVVTPALV